jgi:hypothetical protein
MILIFDDEKGVRDNFKKEFAGQNVNLAIIESETKKDLKSKLDDRKLMVQIKALIFDLSTTKEEAESGKFEVLEYIKDNYKNYALPIFIHSAFSKLVQGYDEVGTVFKVQKDTDSIKEIVEKLKLFNDTGFLNIFCPSGYLETEIYKAIHKAFNTQFKGEEIEMILKSIANSTTENAIQRTKDVFERIAIRCLYQNLISSKKEDDSDQIEEIKMNAVEHYYRRTSDFKVWTGDIFIDSSGQQVVILTPRCDINNGVCKEQFLACRIEKLENDVKKKMGLLKDVNKYLTDNPQQSGIKSRFLVPAPNYEGGKVNLTDYLILPLNKLSGSIAEYKYLISLSDELINEVVRKFASYILRGGISASEISEASFYSNNN